MLKNHRPRKRFGQNFLHDSSIIDAIVLAAELSPVDLVLEIGPGQGALTNIIAPQVSRLDIIEVDRDLAADFIANGADNLHIHVGDALKLDWAKFLYADNHKLVANLPYNISTQILFKMIHHRAFFERMVLMFQKEVADRLQATAGTRSYGALTILCQLWFDVNTVVTVPPGAFRPPPKVMSQVLCLTRRSRPLVEVGDFSFFQHVVKASFAQRRKTLRNCLNHAGFAVKNMDKLGVIDLHRRGETLTIDEFSYLSRQLQQMAADI